MSRIVSPLAAICLLTLSACTGPTRSSDTLQVSLGSGFSLATLLLQPEKIDVVPQVAPLLDKVWYAPIEVMTGQNAQPTLLDNCDDYLVAPPPILTLRQYEAAAFTELAVNCLAASFIASAQPSQHSFIDNGFIDETLPQRLPSQVAMITSTSEHALVAPEQKWGQVNTLIAFAAKVSDAGIYTHPPGEQELAEMARGDFTGDGVEDVLLSSFDHVRSGSYAGLRLFLVSRTGASQPYQVRQLYPLNGTK